MMNLVKCATELNEEPRVRLQKAYLLPQFAKN